MEIIFWWAQDVELRVVASTKLKLLTFTNELIHYFFPYILDCILIWLSIEKDDDVVKAWWTWSTHPSKTVETIPRKWPFLKSQVVKDYDLPELTEKYLDK